MQSIIGYARQQLRFELEDAVGYEHVASDEQSLQDGAIDHYWMTYMWSRSGRELPLPDFIVRPGSTAEVSQVLRICTTHKIPVITRGGGSGTQGGASTPYGGVVLDLTRMDKVVELDETSLVVTVEAGINGRVLEDQLNQRGLMLAHYPSSVDISTAGGYVAARGSGVMSTKYGKAEDIVLSLEVVMPDGRVIDTLTVPNHACGPGMLQLFVGSEGTLGVITKVRFRLDPIPEKRLFRVVEFPTTQAGIEAGRRIMIARLQPAVLRLYDPEATRRSLVATGHDLDDQKANFVIMVDGYPEIAEAQLARILAICAEEGGVDKGSDEGEHWWNHRYDFYKPPLMPGYPLMYGTVETVTTYDKMPAIYEEKRRLITEEFKEWGTVYSAHFSHWYPWGTMIYDRFYIAEPPQDPEESLRLHNRIWAAASRINLELGGVLNEHHGIGIKLGWLMPEMSGEAFEVLQDIKNVIDPKGIMNPGKLGFGIA